MPSRPSALAALTFPLTGCVGAPVLSVPGIDAQSCPPSGLDVAADDVRCSHTEADRDLEVTVDPDTVSSDRESLDAVSLTIRNGGSRSVSHDPGQRRLSRHAGWGWRERETPRWNGEHETIDPGGTHGWRGPDARFRVGAAGTLRRGAPAMDGPALHLVEALFRVVRRVRTAGRSEVFGPLPARSETNASSASPLARRTSLRGR
jgi:hypothetical protein